MSQLLEALEVAQRGMAAYRAFEHAEKLLAGAANLERSLKELEVAKVAAKADYDAAVVAADEARREEAEERAQCTEGIRVAQRALAGAEAATVAAIEEAEVRQGVVAAAIAMDLDNYRAQVAAEKAALGKEVAALRDERDSLLRALSELKRLAAR